MPADRVRLAAIALERASRLQEQTKSLLRSLDDDLSTAAVPSVDSTHSDRLNQDLAAFAARSTPRHVPRKRMCRQSLDGSGVPRPFILLSTPCVRRAADSSRRGLAAHIESRHARRGRRIHERTRRRKRRERLRQNAVARSSAFQLSSVALWQTQSCL